MPKVSPAQKAARDRLAAAAKAVKAQFGNQKVSRATRAQAMSVALGGASPKTQAAKAARAAKPKVSAAGKSIKRALRSLKKAL